MSVIIKRKTGWGGIASKIQVKVNGEKVKSINENQEIEVQLADDTAYLSVSQMGNKSNKIKVKDGDSVEIKSTLWARIGIFVLILIFFSTLFIQDSLIRTYITSIMCVSAIFSVFIKGCYLRLYKIQS